MSTGRNSSTFTPPRASRPIWKCATGRSSPSRWDRVRPRAGRSAPSGQSPRADERQQTIRKHTMKSSCIGIAGIATLAWIGATPAAAADDVSFAGKTITMTIGFGAGGGVDLYGRMLGRYLVRNLPGQPSLIVMNQLGAGGVVALNDWSNK